MNFFHGLDVRGATIDAESVMDDIHVMKSRLRNITITLEEDVARWARIEAARNETSVSRFLAAILKDRMVEKDRYERAMLRAPCPGTQAFSQHGWAVPLPRGGS